MKLSSILCLMLWAITTTTFAQPTFADAKRFADKPNPDAPDSIRVYAALLQEKDSLRLWLRMHSLLAYEKLYGKKKNVADAQHWYEVGQRPWRQPRQRAEWVNWASLQTNIAYFQSNFKYDLVKADFHYEAARAVYQDSLHMNNASLAKNVLTPLGIIASRQRDYEKAQHYLNAGKEISIAQSSWNDAANSINIIGMMYVNKEHYTDAGRVFQEGLALPGINSRYKILLSLNLGLALLKQGNLKEALQITNTASDSLNAHAGELKTYQAHELFANLHDNLGNIFQEQKNWPQAAFHFHQRLAYTQQLCGDEPCRDAAQANLQLADFFTITEQPDSVLYYIKAALHQMALNAALPDVFANPDSVLLRPDQVFYNAFRRKIEFLQLKYAQKPEKSLLFTILETCDRLFYTDELLRRQYDFEDTKLLRSANSHPYYAAAVDASFRLFATEKKPQYAVQAWQYAELAHERLLATSMQKQEGLEGVPETTQRRLEALQNRRINLMTQFYAAQQANQTNPANGLEKQLFEAHTAWVALLDSLVPDRSNVVLPRINLASVQQSLTPDQALLQYFVADSSRIYVFVVTQHTLDMVECPAVNGLNRVISNFQMAMVNSERRALGEDIELFKTSADQLYDLLLVKPLSLLPSYVKRMVIVPDGALHEIPFELLGKANQLDNFFAFPYLLRRFSVSYASSSQLFLKQYQTVRTFNERALVPFVGFAPQYNDADTLRMAGNPVRLLQGKSSPANDLPEARKEVTEIAGMLSGKAYLSAAAHEAQFKESAPQARIVHLAMHAFLDRKSPLFSKFLFAYDPQLPNRDNDLYALEIYGMQLPSRMVVMSACETGMGVFQPGEGVMSLGRAFAHTGTPTLLMSLWPVEDKSTRLVMVDFYRQIMSGLPTDEALRLAKLQYLALCSPAKANPYYWAGFVALGDMSPVYKK
jgi:CHAT domain-containing protein